jgi:hypothetical protein
LVSPQNWFNALSSSDLSVPIETETQMVKGTCPALAGDRFAEISIMLIPGEAAYHNEMMSPAVTE